MATKAVSIVELLAQIDVNPDDPRVTRILELSAKRRMRRISEEEEKEKLSILRDLMEEAKAAFPKDS